MKKLKKNYTLLGAKKYLTSEFASRFKTILRIRQSFSKN